MLYRRAKPGIDDHVVVVDGAEPVTDVFGMDVDPVGTGSTSVDPSSFLTAPDEWNDYSDIDFNFYPDEEYSSGGSATSPVESSDHEDDTSYTQQDSSGPTRPPLNEEQARFLAVGKTGRNIFVTGAPGELLLPGHLPVDRQP